MRPGFIGAAVICLTVAPARAADKLDANYICTGLSAGGIAYNSTQKSWHGTIFREQNDIFVIQMKHLGTDHQTAYGNDVVSDRFNVAIKRQSQKYPDPCVGKRGDLKNPAVTVLEPNGYISCTTIGWEYLFNPQIGRFTRTYPWGYVDGLDNGDNTPSITAGTCIKLD